MEYGNYPYAATNTKPGEKKLRTQMRVGFARDTSEEVVQDYLHTGLRSQGPRVRANLRYGRNTAASSALKADSVIQGRRLITQWRDKRCKVIVGVDANEDVSSYQDSSFRQRLCSIGLEEAILQRHPSRTAATQHRNKRGRPIDGAFATSGVVIKAGGYYNFDDFFACDHRGLWIDIDLERSLGSYHPEKTPYKPRKLTMLDTAAVRRYLRLVHQGYDVYSIPSRLEQLHRQLRLNIGIMTEKMGR
ncbi:unnamed protein product [Cylindrotheca closterium]|uniref:Uncharacterized protein n=1 Tax=Cylindrotheca closterium TaxID=2856 RepID=A0AAD2G554_9STRA|nr:unnamed protein product [Cylindrotheca closterium]